MAEKYFAECACGKRIRVELFHAGMQKVCPSCKSAVMVPDSTKLKELSNIRWVPEAIAAEDEYKLSVGKSQPLVRSAT